MQVNAMKSEISAGSSPIDTIESPAPESETAIPAAVPVERGRFVLQLHNRDEDSDGDDASENDDDDGVNNKNDNDGNKTNTDAPDSPKSFNSDEIFEDVEVEQGEDQVSDHDLERLLGPLPLRRVSNNNNASEEGNSNNNNNHLSSLELDSNASDDSRRKRSKQPFCPCCPNAVRRGPWQMLLAMTGNDGSTPVTRVGNMIVILPRCFYDRGFGIMGPHWFGPVSCLALLTIATAYFAPKAYRNIGPISATTCLLFYITAVVSLCVVSCSDPGVVKSGTGPDGRDGGKGYAGLPTTSGSAGRGWRYCDLCSVYQPPDAVHCPDCNVCVEGYDHHCPWMGTCIGKKNFTSFLAFNMSWLFYLLYAIIWVTLFGNVFTAVATNSNDDDDM